MAYQLLFNAEEAAFDLVVPKGDWDRLSRRYPEDEEIRKYLGENIPWEDTPERMGYGGCAMVKEEWGRMRATFPVEKYTLRRTLLSLSFLL